MNIKRFCLSIRKFFFGIEKFFLGLSALVILTTVITYIIDLLPKHTLLAELPILLVGVAGAFGYWRGHMDSIKMIYRSINTEDMNSFIQQVLNDRNSSN
jgi:hypothetical protein